MERFGKLGCCVRTRTGFPPHLRAISIIFPSFCVAGFVLLVEDHDLVRTALETALAEAGFQICAVASGAEALQELNRDGCLFDAVLTDIDLGTGPNGWAIAAHARELTPGIPIIYVTGADGEGWSSKGVSGSVLVAKPYRVVQIVRALNRALFQVGGGPDVTVQS
jgi:CheY-like chemotaxis protein